MDPIKNVSPLGGSKTEASGQEPVSGMEGQGTATQPLDAGNQEGKPEPYGKASQHTDAKAQPRSLDTSAAENTTPSQPADRKSDQPAHAASNGTSGDTEWSLKPIEKSTIGSRDWFTNASPFTKGENESQTMAEQELDPKTPSAERPENNGSTNQGVNGSDHPNHLGEDVPPGLNTVIVDPTDSVYDPVLFSNLDLPSLGVENVPPGQSGSSMGKGKGKGKATEADLADYESSSVASNHSTWTRNESVATDYTITSRNTYSTAGTGASTLGSRRQSGAVQAPHSQGKTLTAGGIPLGQRAMIEREHRQSSTIHERHFGHIDDITASNTERNSRISFSESGPSLSKYQDWESDTISRAPAASPPAANVPTNDNRLSSVDSKAVAPPPATAEAKKENRRHSSVMERAKGLGRKFSIRIKPSSK